MHQGTCPTCPRTAHTCALALSQRCLPTESLPRGSRGFPASQFEFSQHRLMHPATVGDESTSLVKWLSLVMFLCRAFPCRLVRSADFGVGGAMTETSQVGSEDYFSSSPSASFPEARRLQFGRLPNQGRHLARDASTGSYFFQLTLRCVASPRP